LALIKPSYKEKRKYILVEASNNFDQIFIDRFIYFFGIYGLAEAGIVFVKNLCRSNQWVIRVSRDYVYRAIIIISLCNGKVIGVFPTLKKLRDFLNKQNKI